MPPKKAAELAAGDTVRLSDREANAADVKSQLFFPHYRGLVGTIVKTYPDGTANVHVPAEGLPAQIRARHSAGTDAMRQKWLDGLSDESRNKLSASEKKFSLRYNLLVALEDLSPTDAPAPQASLEMDGTEPARKSSAELEEAEARHLAEVARKGKA